jgi:PhnB protein
LHTDWAGDARRLPLNQALAEARELAEHREKTVMSTKPDPIPKEYHAVTPYLVVKGAAAAIEFYRKAFSATETLRLDLPGGKIGHAEIRIGDSIVMLADEFPDMGFSSPETIGGTPVSLHLYVEDVDAVFQKAMTLGCKELKPLQDQFYGDRTGTLQDPYGHVWTVATHIEDVSLEEVKNRLPKSS